MKNLLFAAFAALAFVACDKETPTITPDTPNTSDGAVVTMTFIDEPASRAFFSTAATAEAWEKSLSSLSVYVFNAKGDLVTERQFTASELADKTATFALPHATAGTTCDFYAVANMPLTDVTTKASLLETLETSAADYNGTFAEVSTQAKRTGGFVMTAFANKTIAAEGATTNVALTLKRTVAKVAVQTSVAPGFGDKYSGTLTVTGTRLLKAASQSPIIAPASPAPGAMSYTHTQAPAAVTGGHGNLFYLFENGPLAESGRVTLEITALYDADGNAATTDDRMEIVYTVPLTGKAGGEIARNGYYRVAATLSGLVGQDCQVALTVAEWEAPVTQNVDLGA